MVIKNSTLTPFWAQKPLGPLVPPPPHDDTALLPGRMRGPGLSTNSHSSLLACDFVQLMHRMDEGIPSNVIFEHIAEHFSQCQTEYFLRFLERVRADEKLVTSNLGHVITLYGIIPLFLMQVGFIFLEVTHIRSTNINELLVSSMVNLGVATLVYFLLGHALHLGQDASHMIGSDLWLLLGVTEPVIPAFWWAVCILFVSIASSTFVGRLSLTAQMVMATLLSGLIFPVSAHWTGHRDGWLMAGMTNLSGTVTKESVVDMWPGLQDLGGALSVHVAAGTVALVGALILGRRRTRLDMIDVSSFPPSSPGLLLAAQFFLLAGYMGFHVSAVYANDHPASDTDESSRLNKVGLAMVSTIAAAATASLSTLLLEVVAFRRRLGYRLLLDLVHGSLAGVVAVSALAHEMACWAALVSGAVAGIIRCLLTKLFYISGYEDPCDTAAIHLGCGMWSILSVALLSAERGLASGNSEMAMKLFWWHCIGVLAVVVWAAVMSGVPLLLMWALQFLRSNRDIREHRLALEDDRTRRRSGIGSRSFFRFNDDLETMYELLLRNPWNRGRYTQELFWRLLDNFRVAGPTSISRATSDQEPSLYVQNMQPHTVNAHRQLARPQEPDSGRHSRASVKSNRKHHL